MALVPNVGDVIVLVTPDETQTPWQREAPARTAIRRYLILVCGWHRWERADRKAEALVRMARAERKVNLPAGWDSPFDLSSWIAFSECELCGRPFTPRSSLQIYCSDKCNYRARRIREDRVILRRCSFCGDVLETRSMIKLFCSRHCRRAAESARLITARLDVKEDRARCCLDCRKPIPVEMLATARYCSEACRKTAAYKRQVATSSPADLAACRERRNAARREKRRLAKLNGAANGHAQSEADREVDSETGGLSTARPSPDLGYQKR